MATKNLILEIEEDLYQNAQACATNRGISLSSIVCDFLEKECSFDDLHQKRTQALKKIYAEADGNTSSGSEPLISFTRDEIYAVHGLR